MIIDETDGPVLIGANCEIFETAILTGPLSIGDDVYIGPYAVVGGPAQHRGSYPCSLDSPRRAVGVCIKNRACVREFVQIHQGLTCETMIGEDVLLMAGAHIAHDSHIGDGATLGSFSILGGFTIIDDAATFGQAVVTHPWTIIGEGAMVGLNSSVVKDVMPFTKVAGAPARLLGSNQHRDESLPSVYDATLLGWDVWDRWGELLKKREDMRKRWSLVA
jgi:UDP-N-acetylglucosamine acyltransferase